MQNWYIDFDGTLYNTEKLKEDLLNVIIKKVEYYNVNRQDTIKEVKGMFNRENIYNIYNLAIFFANKYRFESKQILNEINEIIENGEKYLYEDSIEFIKKLKEKGYTTHIFTYADRVDFGYQNAKIKGSKISDMFDIIIITSQDKHTLNINYEKGIFVDDNTKVLKGLYSVNPHRLIRIKRKGSKYSSAELEEINIEEYENLDEIVI